MNRPILLALLFAVAGTSMGQAVAPDYVASPDVYKPRAENDQYRIVEGTWKPGQRDAFHSHGAQLYYWFTPCTLRSYTPDGNVREFSVSAGQAGSQASIPSHSVENASASECKVLIFEPKQ